MTEDEAFKMADEYKALVGKRTGIKPRLLSCPRENSEMTPCIARDGRLAVASGVGFVCVGCGESIEPLFQKECEKH